MHLAIRRAADDAVALGGDGDTIDEGASMVNSEALSAVQIPEAQGFVPAR